MKGIRISNKFTNRESASFRAYLNEIAEIKMFTPEEEEECSRRALEGDKKATHELIRRNLRFVISIAKQYETSTISLEDLVNEGNIGLVMAAESYNPSTGFKFITYAVFWIRKLILEYLAKNGRLIRLPSNKINSLTKYTQQLSKLEQKVGGDVTTNDVVNELGATMSLEEIQELESISSMKFDSLDNPLSESDSSSLYEIISDDTFKSSDHLLNDADIKYEITTILNGLKPRDKDIMICLFGLDGSTPMGLQEVSERVGLSREMVRQIKEKSLKTLRKNYSF